MVLSASCFPDESRPHLITRTIRRPKSPADFLCLLAAEPKRRQQSATKLSASLVLNGGRNAVESRASSIPRDEEPPRETTEKIVKKFVLAVAFASAFAAGAIAQTSGLAPRDPPFGKGDASNDTMNEPNSTGTTHGASNQNLLPREPAFGKGNAGNDSMHEPNSAGSKYSYSSGNQIPPRDPPFGKGDADNDTTHLPSSATTRGMASDGTGQSTKKSAATKSAMKKDATKKDAAPKTDTN
jgi:hypothetical protein